MINIIIPAAGLGKRFSECGYKKPKPLIELGDKFLIEWAMSNYAKYDCKFIIVTQKKYYQDYPSDFGYLESKYNACISLIDELTEGAANTVLVAEKECDFEHPCCVVNCDQFMSNQWDYENFIEDAFYFDGSIITFTPTDSPKWSFVKTDGREVLEVAEKRVISNRATTGSGYFWWECTQLFNSIRSMIKNNIRTNNEFYFAPCYNELIKSGGKVTYFDININDFWELGSPEGVNQFKKIYKNGEFERTDKHR